MREENKDLISIDEMMDAKFGKVGTPEREAFRKEAYAYRAGELTDERTFGTPFVATTI